MYCEAVIDAKHDFEKTQSECNDVTLDYKVGRKGIMKLSQMFARLFAELL